MKKLMYDIGISERANEAIEELKKAREAYKKREKYYENVISGLNKENGNIIYIYIYIYISFYRSYNYLFLFI